MSPWKRHIQMVVLACFAICLAAGSFWVDRAAAEDVKALLKQAQKDLRGAQRSMFSGKTDAAVAALPAIFQALEKVKAADPGNSSLKGLEAKYQKLVKDLERRTGKDLGGGTTTVSGAGEGTALPEKPAVKPLDKKAAPAAAGQEAGGKAKLPYAARRPIQSAVSNLSRMAGYAANLDDPGYPGDKGQVVQNMENQLAEIRKQIDEAKALAAEKGVTSHPDFDAAEKRLEEAGQEASAAKARYVAAKGQAEARAKSMEQDVAALKALADEMTPYFSKAPGTVTYYNDLKTLEDVITAIEEFETTHRARVAAELKKFGEVYGTSKDAIDQKTKALGYSGVCCPGFFYRELADGVENMAKTRTAMAADILGRAREMKEVSSSKGHDFYRAKSRKTIRQWAQMAARFSADLPEAASFLAGLDEWEKKDRAALAAKIDAAKWPGKHAGDAPADAKNLAKTAMDWLEKENTRLAAKDKDPRKMLGVVVTGPWYVIKRNLLNNPIQYGLPILGAVQLESEKGADLARVYQLSLLTAEGENVQPKPPFTGAAVGDSYYIRPSAVK